MGATLFLARRLALSSGGKKSSPAVRVAIAAVALSLIVMMWAIAIVTGFKDEITRKVTGFNSHIVLTPEQQDQADAATPYLTLTPTLSSIISDIPYITDASLQASIPAIFKTQDDFKGIYLKSLTGICLQDFIASSIEEGHMPDYALDPCRNEVVISRKAADQLGLKPGSRIDTYFMTDAVRVRPLIVAGIFNSHFDSFDDSFAYASLPLIQEMGNLTASQGTSLAITVSDFRNIDEYSSDLQHALLSAYSEQQIYRLYRVTSATRSGAAYFQWLSLLDLNVVVVLALMTVVACVTLVSGMLILMVDKIRFIALMSALGATRRQISRIFMLMAARIAIYGMLIGDLVGLSLLFIQRHTHFLPLDPDSYYIDFVPVEISIPAILLLNAAVLAVIWIVLIIPSRFAGRAAPARTLATE